MGTIPYLVLLPSAVEYPPLSRSSALSLRGGLRRSIEARRRRLQLAVRLSEGRMNLIQPLVLNSQDRLASRREMRARRRHRDRYKYIVVAVASSLAFDVSDNVGRERYLFRSERIHNKATNNKILGVLDYSAARSPTSVTCEGSKSDAKLGYWCPSFSQDG